MGIAELEQKVIEWIAASFGINEDAVTLNSSLAEDLRLDMLDLLELWEANTRSSTLSSTCSSR